MGVGCTRQGGKVRDGGGLYQAGGKGEGWGWAVPGRGGR